MKRLFSILIMLFVSTILLGQVVTNYKEGDFTGKQLKAKSWKFDNNWLIDKGATGTISWKYNGTAVATMTSAGTFAPTALSTATLTGTTTTGTTITATTTLGVGSQTLTQTNTNMATLNNSLKVTDTLFLGGVVQYLMRTAGNSNRINFEGSVATGASDTITAGLGELTSLKVSGTSLLSGAVTASVLPTFSIAAGQVTMPAADTIGFAVAGLTTNAIVLVSPVGILATTDTMPYVKTVRAGWLTLGGKYASVSNYWIPKK